MSESKRDPVTTEELQRASDDLGRIAAVILRANPDHPALSGIMGELADLAVKIMERSERPHSKAQAAELRETFARIAEQLRTPALST